MYTILDYVSATQNPSFVKAFKANYLQMATYLKDLKESGANLKSTPFDVKAYYSAKNRRFFINYGLTVDQVDDAYADAKDGLELLINLGSTRRKRMSSKSNP
jgi:hypothetical protein